MLEHLRVPVHISRIRETTTTFTSDCVLIGLNVGLM